MAFAIGGKVEGRQAVAGQAHIFVQLVLQFRIEHGRQRIVADPLAAAANTTK